MNDFLFEPGSDPGFRLHKLEVFNWGTFDSSSGTVHCVRPQGQTTLLIGQNGSGKSTLVDALLTLLVRPVVRNYNVAAGARKQERDERTYIRGAYGRFSREDDNRAEVQFLRPGNSHHSILLACFRNDETQQVFTVAVVLYLTAEGRPDRVYCFAPEERSIAAHFAELKTVERLRQQLEKRGFRATNNYTEYHSWFAKLVGVRPKAMDVFNQTVAVKDIQSLNKFIREHMLEAKPWGERVDRLLSHFTELSEAHQSLVRVRRQFELLEPIAKLGPAYWEQADRLEQLQRLQEASDSFFRKKTVELFGPECDRLRREVTALNGKAEQLGKEMEEVRDEQRRLQNEIEQAGGERLRQIPLLIRTHETSAQAKRSAHARYHGELRAAGIDETVVDAESFATIRTRLASLAQAVEKRAPECVQRRDDLVLSRATVANNLREQVAELEALKRRQGNLPERVAQLRARLCEDLRLSPKDLPFAAELIAVKPEGREWASSIEMVLRGLALSLLVPQRHYNVVNRYIDQTRLADGSGQGQRLVYLRVGDRADRLTGPVSHPHSLLNKLDFRTGHALLPWVRAELAERYDYRCCETVEEFQEAPAPAITRQRHVKMRGARHEKDDRERATDPRFFVLGWDNREKRQHLAEEIRLLGDQETRLNLQIEELGRELARLQNQASAAKRALEVTAFSTIDYGQDEKEIQALNLEKQHLEEQDDTIRVLKERLAAAKARHESLQSVRDETIKAVGALGDEAAKGERLIRNAEEILRRRDADGTLAFHAQAFADIDAFFVAEPLSPAGLLVHEQSFLKSLHADADQLRRKLEPLKAEISKVMNQYLRHFPDERADLDADVRYLESFLSVRKQLEREDLPRHEQRFKERLNEKVIQEIGLLNGDFQSERSEIATKIDTLNASLRQLDYRQGTCMQLEPRPVRDGEVVDFQASLRECLAGTFEGTLEADEARYLRIEKLVHRLREEERWREKVTDVRRWFDFVAREIDRETGQERNYYEDSAGQSGGEKAKLAFTILVAAIAYQYDIDPNQPKSNRFHFVVVDEMFSKVDDCYSEYALELFRKFSLQLLIVAPLDAKARVTEPYVGCYLHVVKDPKTNRSEILSMTAREFQESVVGNGQEFSTSGLSRRRPR